MAVTPEEPVELRWSQAARDALDGADLPRMVLYRGLVLPEADVARAAELFGPDTPPD